MFVYTGFSAQLHFYPAINSIGRDTKFTVYFLYVGYGILSRGFTDRHEILHGSSA